MNYYNDYEPFAAQWLKNLIAAGLLPPGDVDSRPIQEVKPSDLKGYIQCHFFCGIGGWPLALQLAGWPADRPVWTGSCPCPPFSVAGKKKNCPECESRNLVPCPRRTGYFICCDCGHAWFADERHLWPEFWRLISECRPAEIFGEQVASEDGRIWLAGVRASLEILGYAVGGSDLCAAGVGAPHIRQRLWWVADRLADSAPGGFGIDGSTQRECGHTNECGSDNGMDNATSARCTGETEPRPSEPTRKQARMQEPERRSGFGRLAHPGSTERGSRTEPEGELRGTLHATDGGGAFGLADTDLPSAARHRQYGGGSSSEGFRDGSGDCGINSPSPLERSGGFWSDAILIPCRDGKARRIKPGLAPLVARVPGDVGIIRAAGNSIVPKVGAEFIIAYLEAKKLLEAIQ